MEVISKNGKKYRTPSGKNVDRNALQVVAAQLSMEPRKSYREISRLTGVSPGVVKGIDENPKILPDKAIVDLIKKNTADLWYMEMAADLGAITPKKRAAASAYQLRGMAGIAHQNARLADGSTTQNVGIAVAVSTAMAERMDSGE